jgi:hypothetical protein
MSACSKRTCGVITYAQFCSEECGPQSRSNIRLQGTPLLVTLADGKEMSDHRQLVEDAILAIESWAKQYEFEVYLFGSLINAPDQF